MITGNDFYRVMSAMVPLYLAVALGFASVKCLHVFTKEQCAAVNRYVAFFAVPFLCFQVIATTDLFQIDAGLVAADTVAKTAVLSALFFWSRFCRPSHRSASWAYDWMITSFMISSLPNTLVIGVPVLGSMYGSHAQTLMAQLVVAQVIWFSVIMVLFELRAARSESMRVYSLGRGAMGRRGEAAEEEVGGGAGEAGVEEEDGMEGVGMGVGEWEGEGEAGHGNGKPDDVAASPSATSPPPPARLEPSLSRADLAVVRKMTLRLLLRKLAKNPNIWACLGGAAYSLASFGIGFGYPTILANSVDIIAKTGLGMAMFSLGLFMANQSGWVPCGWWVLTWTSCLRFFFAPALMAALSVAFGLRNNVLRFAIVQAALPLGIAPFIFANEYKVHPEVISTGVSIGTLISLPIIVLLYLALSFI